MCVLEAFASYRWQNSLRISEWEGELGFIIMGWEELQRPEESEHLQEAWEAEIGEIEEIMPPVSFKCLCPRHGCGRNG